MFRILKTTTENNAGSKTYSYTIQKKFIFWWFNYRIPVLNTIDNGDPLYDKRTYSSYDLNKIQEILQELEDPFIEIYKGVKIVKIFYNNFDNMVFINENNYYNPNLSRVKERIDEKIIKITKNVVNGKKNIQK